MLSKNKLKYIRSLSQKKFRDADNVFIAEGPKVVGDLLGCFPCKILLGTPEYLACHKNIVAEEIIEVEQKELEQASTLKSPRDTMAIFSQKRLRSVIKKADSALQPLSLALDDVQDPGNLGTIIRLADWYGIENVYCSQHCADVYSTKVIQATMGAIARVQVHYVDLVDFIKKQKADIGIYGTFLDGNDMYQMDLSAGGLIVMGNEGNGISAEIEQLVNRKLYIPNYPIGQATSESLNVAVATAITCAEFRRQSLVKNKTQRSVVI